jgi:glycogen synthase
MAVPFSIAFAGAEVWPFVPGGGLGRAVWAAATVLAPHAEVTIVTSDRLRAEHDRLSVAGDPRLPDGVRFEFVPEPDDDVRPFRSWHHAWSGRLLEGVRDAYSGAGPELLEFADYMGEGLAAVEAKRSGDPFLAHTQVLTRIHTTYEVAASLNEAPDQPDTRLLRALERIPLRFADRVLWPGGDVLATYERFYGREAIASAQRIGLAFVAHEPEPADRRPPAADSLRLLYLGRLEWRKGVHQLLAALHELEGAPLELTVVGGDTDTAPDGGSVSAELQRIADGDSRIAFRDRVPFERIADVVRDHHVVISPSLWEAWSNVVREALMYNRPVLATPVGGVIDVVVPGRSGWLTRDTGVRAVRDGIAELLDRRAEIDAMIEDGAPRATLDAAIGNDAIVAAYRDLASTARRLPTSRPATLAAVITCGPGERRLALATLRSLAAQTTPIEVVLVVTAPNELPALAALEHVSELVPAPGQDRVTARLAGLARCRADGAVLLDAGDELEPEFAAAVGRALGEPARLPYATALGPETPPPIAPLGNWVYRFGGEEPPAILAVRLDALDFPLPVPDVGRHEDQALARELAQRGRFGAVLPRRLVAAVARRRCESHTPTPPIGQPERARQELWLAPWPAGQDRPVALSE